MSSYPGVEELMRAAMSQGIWGQTGVDVYLDGAVQRHQSATIYPWGVKATDWVKTSLGQGERATYYPAAQVRKVVPIDKELS